MLVYALTYLASLREDLYRDIKERVENADEVRNLPDLVIPAQPRSGTYHQTSWIFITRSYIRTSYSGSVKWSIFYDKT